MIEHQEVPIVALQDLEACQDRTSTRSVLHQVAQGRILEGRKFVLECRTRVLASRHERCISEGFGRSAIDAKYNDANHWWSIYFMFHSPTLRAAGGFSKSS